MGWVFLDDADEAKDGVTDGKYYAAVVIPEDFSENLLSITTGKFKQAKLQYYVNEKKNAVAPKITDKGIEAIRDNVDSEYVSAITEALAVIILIMQVAGSGGTFPIEVLPEPFKFIAPFLPFKYGINALRETVAGVDAGNYIKNLGLLLLFIIPALVLGLLLRKPCIKIISFFNNKVEESDLVI